MPWNRLFDSLARGQVDVVMNQVTITPARLQRFDFSAPYIFSGMQLMAMKHHWAQLGSLQSLGGKRIGVGDGTYYEQWLRANVPQAAVVTFTSNEEKFAALQKGQIDGVLVSRLTAFKVGLSSGETMIPVGHVLAEEQSGILLPLHQNRLKAALNRALDAMRQNGALTRLSDFWFKADVTHPAQ
jgi:cystine transport system substrate-binding protein